MSLISSLEVVLRDMHSSEKSDRDNARARLDALISELKVEEARNIEEFNRRAREQARRVREETKAWINHLNSQ